MDSIFEREEFKPFVDEWQARQAEFARREAYYDGSVYTSALNGLGWLRPRAGAEIRPLYLPLSRAVNVDAGIIPGGWTLAPGLPDRERLERGRELVLRWSRWPQEGVLYVHYGAVYGASGLRVSDLRESGRVVIAPVSPRRFMLAGRGMYDRRPGLAIYVERRLIPEGLPSVAVRGGRTTDTAEFEYAEVITPERIRTFADGEPCGFDGRPAEYPNALGFVPFVEVQHINVGGAIGDCAFEKVIPLLDQVNRLASELADLVHRHRDPQYVISGAEPGDLVRGGENAWFIPEGAKVEILVAGLDIPGVLSFIRESRAQVQSGLVQLGFDEITGRNVAVAAETIRLQLLELILYVRRTRPNYDEGLVSALRMAGRAARGMTNDQGRRTKGMGVSPLGLAKGEAQTPLRSLPEGSRIGPRTEGGWLRETVPERTSGVHKRIAERQATITEGAEGAEERTGMGLADVAALDTDALALDDERSVIPNYPLDAVRA